VTRRIVHVDMDAFYASVEERERPDLAGRPVAVIATARKGAVMTANYAARAFGVTSALPVHFAVQRCPDLVLIPARLDLYREVSATLHAVFARFTRFIEPLALDEAYLDLSAAAADLGEAAILARQIKADILEDTQLTASAGAAHNKFLAKLASGLNKPDGLTVICPGDVDALLASLPVEAFHGVGPVTAARLRERGVTDGATLRSLTRADLVAQFGRHGEHFFEVARGVDERPVEADRESKSVGVERTFDRNLVTRDEMRAALATLAAELEGRLSVRGLTGRTVVLKVRFPDWSLATRRTTLTNAVWAASVLAGLAEGLLTDDLLGGRGVRLLGLSIQNLVTAGHPEAPSLFGSGTL